MRIIFGNGSCILSPCFSCIFYRTELKRLGALGASKKTAEICHSFPFPHFYAAEYEILSFKPSERYYNYGEVKDLNTATIIAAVIALVAGFAAGGAIFFAVGISHRKKQAEAAIGSAEKEAERIVDAAKAEAENQAARL